MAPVKNKNGKHKKKPAPRAATSLFPSLASPIPEVRSVTAPEGGSATLSPEVSRNSQPGWTPLEVADQLHSAAIHLLRRLRVRDRESGIGPAQLSALSVLVFGGGKSLSELADAEQVRPPTISRIVASLERARLVRRHPTEDARRVRLEATPEGVSLMREGRKRRVESLARALEGLPESERQQLHQALILLQQLIRNL